MNRSIEDWKLTIGNIEDSDLTPSLSLMTTEKLCELANSFLKCDALV